MYWGEQVNTDQSHPAVLATPSYLSLSSPSAWLELTQVDRRVRPQLCLPGKAGSGDPRETGLLQASESLSVSG